MKFLVISRPNGQDHGLASGYDRVDNISDHNKALKGLLKDNTVENAYAFISGGSAVVINADSTKELAIKVRHNPLFKSCNTEIIPIADAIDFLDGVVDHLS